MNKKLKDLALQIGGSLYPEVGRDFLPTTVQLVLEDAIRTLQFNGYDDAADCLKGHAKSYESLH